MIITVVFLLLLTALILKVWPYLRQQDHQHQTRDKITSVPPVGDDHNQRLPAWRRHNTPLPRRRVKHHPITVDEYFMFRWDIYNTRDVVRKIQDEM